jgi:hypothetical protein
VVEPLSTDAVSVPASCANAISAGVRIKLKHKTRAKNCRSASNLVLQSSVPRPIIIVMKIDPDAASIRAQKVVKFEKRGRFSGEKFQEI